MLPDQVTELLTAFVDGELSQRQRKEVTRLLQRSSEARKFLRQLQENAHRIKQLPRRKVEPSLVDEILRAIAEQKSQPKQPMMKPVRRRRWAPYIAATLAASLLIGVIGLLYYQSMDELHNKGQQVVVVPPPEKKSDPAPELPTPRKLPNPLLHAMVDDTYRGFAAPVLPDPIFIARFSDLKNEGGATSGQLKHELNKDRTVQFEITVKDNAIAMERLNRAFAEQGIKVVIDPKAKKTMTDKKQQAKAEYWVFAENLTTDELAKMMSELSQVDTTGMGKAVPSPYEKVTVTPLAKTEKQTLASKLGVEASKLELPKDSGSAKPETPKRWERQAVVLPTVAATSPSKEVVQFVNQRRQPQPGTVQVLIKIHQE